MHLCELWGYTLTRATCDLLSGSIAHILLVTSVRYVSVTHGRYPLRVRHSYPMSVTGGRGAAGGAERCHRLRVHGPRAHHAHQRARRRGGVQLPGGAAPARTVRGLPGRRARGGHVRRLRDVRRVLLAREAGSTGPADDAARLRGSRPGS